MPSKPPPLEMTRLPNAEDEQSSNMQISRWVKLGEEFLGTSSEIGMKKHDVEWNPLTHEWFCTKCFRTSDHTSQSDAERELSQFECSVLPGNGEESKNRPVN